MNTQYVFFLLHFGTTPKNALMSDQDFYIYSCVFFCITGLLCKGWLHQSIFLPSTMTIKPFIWATQQFLLIWFAKKCVLGWPPIKAITKVFKQQLIWFTKVWCSGSKFLQRRAHGGLVLGLFLDQQSPTHYRCLFTGQHIGWWLILMFQQIWSQRFRSFIWASPHLVGGCGN